MTATAPVPTVRSVCEYAALLVEGEGEVESEPPQPEANATIASNSNPRADRAMVGYIRDRFCHGLRHDSRQRPPGHDGRPLHDIRVGGNRDCGRTHPGNGRHRRPL